MPTGPVPAGVPHDADVTPKLTFVRTMGTSPGDWS
jgi:hypothetical protein